MDAFPFQEMSKLLRKDRIAIEDQVPHVQQESVSRISDVSGDLLDPLPVRVRRNACDVHASCRQRDEEQDVVADQAARRPHLNREQVGRGNALPVRLQERAPWHSLAALRRRLNAVFLQDVGDRPAANLVAKIGQRAPDPSVTPVSVLLGET